MEILGRAPCYYCDPWTVSFDLHYWNGREMTAWAFETLPAGAASGGGGRRQQPDLRHPDAMRRAFRLFDGGPGSCREPDCADWPGPPGVAVADAGVTPWRPWRASASALRRLAEAPDGDGLTRLFAAVYREDGERLEQVRGFPLTGRRLDGRTFWAVFDPSADTCRARRRGVSISFASGCTAPVLAVYGRGDGGWRAVARRRVRIDALSAVAPAALEPSNAWISRGRPGPGPGPMTGLGGSRWSSDRSTS